MKVVEEKEDAVSICMRNIKDRILRSQLYELPIIDNMGTLSKYINIEAGFIRTMIEYPELYYREFYIPKKGNGSRQICEPLEPLKRTQRWILEKILIKGRPDDAATAYKKGSSIRSNAMNHVGKSLVLKLDICNFFSSLTEHHVYNLFFYLGYNFDVSTILSKLCCYKNSLPQGAPTSPALSNLIFREADEELGRFCEKNNLSYTRYADDLSFSGDLNPGLVVTYVKEVVNRLGLCINTRKTKVYRSHRRQDITGVIVNKYMRASKKKRMQVRQMFYYLNKFGIEDQARRYNISVSRLKSRFLGYASHLLFLDEYDKDANNLYNYLVKETSGYGEHKKQRSNFKAFKHFAEKGDEESQFILALMYENGRGTAQNISEAVKWYRSSAEQGFPKAQYNLAMMYEKGKGLDQDIPEALKWYRIAAELDLVEAQFKLALVYNKGEGVNQDLNESFKWFKVAAENEYIEAQYNLALMYENGQGIDQDYNESIKWYKKAADCENEDAMYAIGCMYEEGKGVIQSNIEAFKWYKLAAEYGHANAQMNLGIMYTIGKGITSSFELAYFWTLIACANTGCESNKKASKVLDNIAEELNSEVKERIKKEATFWSPKGKNPFNYEGYWLDEPFSGIYC